MLRHESRSSRRSLGGFYGADHLQTLARSIHRGVAPASAEEQQRLLSLVMEALNTVGGKELVICSPAWSNERWPFFGVEEFPDLDAVQRHEQILIDLNWGRYIESRSTLGTEVTLLPSKGLLTI